MHMTSDKCWPGLGGKNYLLSAIIYIIVVRHHCGIGCLCHVYVPSAGEVRTVKVPQSAQYCSVWGAQSLQEQKVVWQCLAWEIRNNHLALEFPSASPNLQWSGHTFCSHPSWKQLLLLLRCIPCWSWGRWKQTSHHSKHMILLLPSLCVPHSHT